mgnify:FL=1
MAESLEYLKLNKEQVKATTEFYELWDDIGPGNCDGNPEPYTGYGDDEGEAPRRVSARYMCSGCPLLIECGDLAALTNAQGVVRGGMVWTVGTNYQQNKKRWLKRKAELDG